MVHATDADAELGPLLAVADTVRGAPRRDAVRRSTRWARAALVTIPCHFDGPDLDEVAALAGCPARRGGGAAHGATPDRRRGRVLAGLRLPRGPAGPAATGAPALPTAPGRAGGVGGDRQRPRRRLSDRVTRAAGTWWGGPGSRLFTRSVPLRRAGAGGPGPASPWPASGDPAEPAPVAAPPWSAAGGRPGGVRDRGARPAGRRPGRRAPGRGGRGRAGGRPGRPGVVRAGQPVGRQRCRDRVRWS